MPELKKGEWSSVVSVGVFVIPEDGTLEFAGLNCTILDSDGNEVQNLNATNTECTVSGGGKAFVMEGKLRLK